MNKYTLSTWQMIKILTEYENVSVEKSDGSKYKLFDDRLYDSRGTVYAVIDINDKWRVTKKGRKRNGLVKNDFKNDETNIKVIDNNTNG